MATTTAKVFIETCANCGHDVTFDAEKIHRENPYWPWIDSGQVSNMIDASQELSRATRGLTDVICTPGTGLIAQMQKLVACFDQLLKPSPVPATTGEDPR